MTGSGVNQYCHSREGRGYHLRAIQFAEAQRRPSLIFNVASVAVEYYLIALCAHHGTEPRNHNYTCLMAAAEQVVEFEPELGNSIRSLDEIFGICSLENYHHGTPMPEDAERTLVIYVRGLKVCWRGMSQWGIDRWRRLLKTSKENLRISRIF